MASITKEQSVLKHEIQKEHMEIKIIGTFRHVTTTSHNYDTFYWDTMWKWQ